MSTTDDLSVILYEQSSQAYYSVKITGDCEDFRIICPVFTKFQCGIVSHSGSFIKYGFLKVHSMISLIGF